MKMSVIYFLALVIHLPVATFLEATTKGNSGSPLNILKPTQYDLCRKKFEAIVRPLDPTEFSQGKDKGIWEEVRLDREQGTKYPVFHLIFPVGYSAVSRPTGRRTFLSRFQGPFRAREGVERESAGRMGPISEQWWQPQDDRDIAILADYLRNKEDIEVTTETFTGSGSRRGIPLDLLVPPKPATPLIARTVVRIYDLIQEKMLWNLSVMPANGGRNVLIGLKNQSEETRRELGELPPYKRNVRYLIGNITKIDKPLLSAILNGDTRNTDNRLLIGPVYVRWTNRDVYHPLPTQHASLIRSIEKYGYVSHIPSLGGVLIMPRIPARESDDHGKVIMDILSMSPLVMSMTTSNLPRGE